MTTVFSRTDSILSGEIAAVSAAVTGPVLQPGEPGYAQETAAFNLVHEQRPAVAVGASSPQDVQAAVSFASRHGMPVAVLATGHGAVAPSDGAHQHVPDDWGHRWDRPRRPAPQACSRRPRHCASIAFEPLLRAPRNNRVRVAGARFFLLPAGLTISGALIFFSSWLARLIQLQREQAELTRRLLDRTPDPDPSSTQLIPVAD